MHARCVAVFDALLELVHPLDDVGLDTRRHFGVLVVLVHHRQVVINVFLLDIHAAQAVLHHHRQFVLEGRVIRDAVRDGSVVHVRVAVFVLQAFAVQRGAASGAAQQEAARAHVARGPAQIADTLDAEHRVVDVERNHRHAMRGIRRCGRDPVAHGASFVDAFLQHLTRLRFLVEHQLVVILRHVLLAFLVPDTNLAEQAFHAERARLIRHDGHDVLTDVLVFQQDVQNAHEGHRRGHFAAFTGGLEQRVKRRQRRNLQRVGLLATGRQVAAEVHARLAHVFQFLRAFFELDVRNMLELIVGNRNVEAITQLADGIHRHLLLLVGDVHRFAGFAHAIALDGLGENDGRLALVVGRRLERRVDLVRIMAAAVQCPDVVVGPIGHHSLEFRGVEEVLAHIGAALRLEGLVLAVDAFHHAAHQQPLGIAGEQLIPTAAPDDLDDVPAGAAEFRFQLLDDLAVAAHRTVQALQVAVDHED